MIDFDRPLRPRWIYETLQLVEPGQRLIELNLPFENIAAELTGKEGKRKVRTVLVRCYLRDEENRSRVKSRLLLKEWAVGRDLDWMSPLYLFYLVGATPILQHITDLLLKLYDFGKEINVGFLANQIGDSHGHRDVVVRAVRSFIDTLVYFGIAEKSEGRIFLRRKLELTIEQAQYLFILLASEIIRSPQVSLSHLPAFMTGFFEFPDLRQVAQRYNGETWDYQHRTDSDYLIIR